MRFLPIGCAALAAFAVAAAASSTPEHVTTTLLADRPAVGLVLLALASLTVLSLRSPSPHERAAWAAATLLWPTAELAGWPTLPTALRTTAEAAAHLVPVALLLAVLPGPWTRDVRRAAAVAVTAGTSAVLVRLLLVDPFLDVDCWRTCAPNPLLIVPTGPLGRGLELVVSALLLGATVSALRRSWSRDHDGWFGERVLRAALPPGAAFSSLLPEALPYEHLTTAAVLVLLQLAAIALGAAAVCDVLAEWTLRLRLTRLARSVRAAPAPGGLRDVLRRALRDQGLDLVYWAPHRQSWLDAEGRLQALPKESPHRRATVLTRDGSTVAALVHSPGARPLAVDRALGAALRLSLVNEQLRAAALAEIGELQVSRARVVERAALERRRLERNLHDGAQQRVVSLALLLRMLADRLPGGPVRDLAEHGTALAQRAGEELRELAHGIHPAVLADAGLQGAVEELSVASTALAVEVGDMPVRRLPTSVETTAYLFVAAALADAGVRGAMTARVHAIDDGDGVHVVVDDDGSPGEDDRLRHLEDRVLALGGSLDVAACSLGSRAVLEVPCASSSPTTSL